jgi:DNA-binding CsgD family transcriptional regulator
MDQSTLRHPRKSAHHCLVIPPLSTRETEVLRWSAEGKTAEDIGLILHLTERTVNFHIANAIKKMGASNKISAVVQAVLSGVL